MLKHLRSAMPVHESGVKVRRDRQCSSAAHGPLYGPSPLKCVCVVVERGRARPPWADSAVECACSTMPTRTARQASVTEDPLTSSCHVAVKNRFLLREPWGKSALCALLSCKDKPPTRAELSSPAIHVKMLFLLSLSLRDIAECQKHCSSCH